MASTIDILFLVYNAAPYIRESLESILSQSAPIQKIFILDDASTDETCSLVEAYTDPRIHLIKSEQNRGIAHQLNKGLTLSDADYIARMDGDDVSFSDRLSIQAAFLDKNLDHVACSGGFQTIDENGNILKETLLDNTPNQPQSIPAHQHFLKHPFLMVRAEALKKINGYNEIHYCEDADLYYRLSSLGGLFNLPTLLGKYRVHEGSISSRDEATNKLQALHSQLMALYYKREGRYHYPEDKALQLHRTLSSSITIETLLDVSSTLYGLQEEETQWLRKAFPVKYIQNITNRSIHISAEDKAFYLALIPELLHTPSPVHQKALTILFKCLRKLPHNQFSLQQKITFSLYKTKHVLAYFIYRNY